MKSSFIILLLIIAIQLAKADSTAIPTQQWVNVFGSELVSVNEKVIGPQDSIKFSTGSLNSGIYVSITEADFFPFKKGIIDSNLFEVCRTDLYSDDPNYGSANASLAVSPHTKCGTAQDLVGTRRERLLRVNKRAVIINRILGLLILGFKTPDETETELINVNHSDLIKFITPMVLGPMNTKIDTVETFHLDLLPLDNLPANKKQTKVRIEYHAYLQKDLSVGAPQIVDYQEYLKLKAELNNKYTLYCKLKSRTKYPDIREKWCDVAKSLNSAPIGNERTFQSL